MNTFNIKSSNINQLFWKYEEKSLKTLRIIASKEWKSEVEEKWIHLC